ncbi:Macrolide export ATP-binding/permease protein MacB [Anaerolineales bacterium]|nr:Macrolide export ATP-binding/permease protein MacB [Anaerolineales bacterium]
MTRWKKVYRDLWNNRSRTVLVVLSIAAGVFAIGMIGSTQQALTASLASQYAELRPADAIFETDPVLDDDFVTSIRHMRGVTEAEGRRSLPLRISLDGEGETWRDLTLYALADYNDQRLFRVQPQSSAWSLEKGQVLMERASMVYIGVQPGDKILIKTPDGRKFRLTVTGSVHDLYRIPPFLEGWIYGYVSMDTIRWMGEPEGYDELYIATSGKSKEEIRLITNNVSDRIEGEGLPVYQETLPNRGEHPLNYIIDTVLLLLGFVAVLSLFLSALLVINIISALIVQQEKQIGVMKAIGARSWQIIGLYFGMVLALGLMACLIAIPLSAVGADALAGFTAGLINFDAPDVKLTLSSLILQLAVGLLVPLIAAAPVILSGTKVSPARVLSEYGISLVWGGAGFLDGILRRFPKLTRDLLLALRNPFRKRGRLILSLVTLTFAGAVFMGIVNLRTSLNSALNEMFGFWRYDAWLILDSYVPTERLVNEVKTVPGVRATEAWDFAIGRYIRPDDSESDDLYLMAPPAGTSFLVPPIIEGRGLKPGDTGSVLVSPGFLAREPTLHLGSPMKIKIEGREETYTIVGIVNMIGNSSIGYMTIMDYSDYARHVREPNRANSIIMTLDAQSLDEQKAIVSVIEKRFDRADIEVISTFLVGDEREEIDAAFSILVILLMIMTLILATVGGLGLMGTMSLNVIERTREIGVMRAYGASSAAIFRIVIIEGLLIGMMSWVLAIILSAPISIVMARSVGISFMSYPMSATYSAGGILAWAALVIIISIVASFLPALNAVRLTVTQVLAYE